MEQVSARQLAHLPPSPHLLPAYRALGSAARHRRRQRHHGRRRRRHVAAGLPLPRNEPQAPGHGLDIRHQQGAVVDANAGAEGQEGVGVEAAEGRSPLERRRFEGRRAVLADLAEVEEEQDGVAVSGFDGRDVVSGVGGGGEEAEGGEEVAGDEEGLVVEGEGVEAAEGEGEEGLGGEQGGEAAAAAEGLGEDGVSEVGELVRWEGGKCCHDGGCVFVHIVYGIVCVCVCVYVCVFYFC
ncbi:hypothetical protein TorRG33x02_014470 [Trema orientale]|uniref:Uncharacterized protein n=1 Tax=Trema orientale TaxID=63057 RepID=A0A2P5FXD4_TREOI|nr:hypothetical protein TorRG33x02_014470 [Trema orientale]